MKKLIIQLVIVVTATVVIDAAIVSVYWRHLAVKHGAAFYEANSWGISSFHWNDTSFAQEPFQDEQWKKVQDSIFQKKINDLNLK